MGEFQKYILDKDKDLTTKMDIVYRLQKLLKEKKGEKFYFDKSVVFKTEIARMFIDYMHLDVDRDLVLTACLFGNCKKVDNPQKVGKLHTYAKEGADYLLNLGFEPRFCRICEGVNRYSGLTNREAESDILELVDQFGGMVLDRPERPGFKPEEALIQMERDNLKNVDNRYLKQFHDFVYMMKDVNISNGIKYGTIEKWINEFTKASNARQLAIKQIEHQEDTDKVVHELDLSKDILGYVNKIDNQPEESPRINIPLFTNPNGNATRAVMQGRANDGYER